MTSEIPLPDARLTDKAKIIQLAATSRDLLHVESSKTRRVQQGIEMQARVSATPFVWRDPSTIPTREWLYAHFLIRRQISLTVAPGGTGKSSLVAVESLAQVIGRPLLHDAPYGQLRVWIWNGEDPTDELERRIAAACLYYEITEEDISGRLFVDSGRGTEICIARMERNGVVIAEPVFDALVETIRKNRIDVVKIDPFVSCHHGNFKDGQWTAEAIAERRWLRSLVREFGNKGPLG
jgi:RecA-family ATPase